MKPLLFSWEALAKVSATGPQKIMGKEFLCWLNQLYKPVASLWDTYKNSLKETANFTDALYRQQNKCTVFNPASPTSLFSLENYTERAPIKYPKKRPRGKASL